MHGHNTEYDLCSEQVDFDRTRANPDGAGKPCHPHCWAEVYGAPEWFTDHV